MPYPANPAPARAEARYYFLFTPIDKNTEHVYTYGNLAGPSGRRPFAVRAAAAGFLFCTPSSHRLDIRMRYY